MILQFIKGLLIDKSKVNYEMLER